MTPPNTPEPLDTRQRRLVLLLTLVCALTRLLSRARTLWEWDEALFVLAMRDFDVTLHHPHPPGFPLFIAAAKLMRLAVSDDFRALQGVTLLSSFLVFPALFVYARALGLRFRTAVTAALLFTFFPNVWFFGGTAFSDVPSVVLSLFSVALLLRGTRSRGAYWGGTLLLAIAIGIRPQNFLIGLVPGLLATRRRRVAEVLIALLLGLIVVGAAYGGAIAASGSADDYFRAVREHGDYIARVDSWRNPDRPALWRLLDRFFVKQYQQPVLSIVASLLVIASIAGGIRERRRPLLLNALTFVPFAVVAWLMLDRYSVSRFSIAYQPMFAVFAADGIRRVAAWSAEQFGVRDPHRAEAGLAALVLTAFVVFAAPSFRTVREEVSPTVRAVNAAKALPIADDDRLYVGHTMSVFMDVLAPEVRYVRVIDDRALPLENRRNAYLLAEITETPREGQVFAREHDALWQIARRHYFDIKLLPIRRLASFHGGWFQAEVNGIDERRQMSDRSVTELPAARGRTKLRLQLGFSPKLLETNPRLTIRLNGRPIDSITPLQGEVDRNWNVQPAPVGRPNVLELSIERRRSDAGATSSGSGLPSGLELRGLAWGPA